MKRRSIAASVVAVLACIAIAGTAIAAPKLLTFGPASVRTDVGTVTIDTSGAGSYGGVYLNSRSMSGKFITTVDFSFVSTGYVTGGAPRFSIPIDTNDDGIVDGYAFLDAANCGATSGNRMVVGTGNSDCDVYFGGEGFANWGAFAAAHPTYRIAPGAIPFIIADIPSTMLYEISEIDLQ
jgi:hypothetical protein